jgi:hypothetical protein
VLPVGGVFLTASNEGAVAAAGFGQALYGRDTLNLDRRPSEGRSLQSSV